MRADEVGLISPGPRGPTRSTPGKVHGHRHANWLTRSLGWLMLLGGSLLGQLIDPPATNPPHRTPPAFLVQRLYPMALEENDREVSAIARWLLQGHAAQRIVAAWHLGWEPAMKTGGGEWLKPLLAVTLADDYGPVRFVAARSLRAQPAMPRFDFNFLAPEAARRKVADQIIGKFLTEGPRTAGGRTDRLEDSTGKLDQTRLAKLLRRQDRRGVRQNSSEGR